MECEVLESKAVLEPCNYINKRDGGSPCQPIYALSFLINSTSDMHTSLGYRVDMFPLVGAILSINEVYVCLDHPFS